MFVQLELQIDHLPSLKEQLVCAFTTADKPTISTNATRKRNGVNCTTPRTDLLPPIPPGKRKILHTLCFELKHTKKIMISKSNLERRKS